MTRKISFEESLELDPLTPEQEQELQEMLERQSKRMANTRRRMVVDNKYHSRKTRSNITPRVLRPILREEKTW